MGGVVLYSGFAQVVFNLDVLYSREQTFGVKKFSPNQINGFFTWHINSPPAISRQAWIIKIDNFCFSFDACLKFPLNLCAWTRTSLCSPCIFTHCQGSLKRFHFASLIDVPLSWGALPCMNLSYNQFLLPESSEESRNQFEYLEGNLI